MAGLSTSTKGVMARKCSPFTALSRAYSSQSQTRQNTYASTTTSVDAHLPATQPLASSTTAQSDMAKHNPLSILPLGNVVRSFLVTSVSSSKVCLPPSLWLMSKLAHAKSPLFNPDKNPLLRYPLKKTFYQQFCAGENGREVTQAVNSLKNMGYKGVILGYAREVVLEEGEQDGLSAFSWGSAEAEEACIKNEIQPWARGCLETVELTSPGDFVALKFTGSGSQALHALAKRQDLPPALKDATNAICDLAKARGVRLLFDAEQASLQPGIDLWTMDYMRKYNKKDAAVVYGTYQAYLKVTPSVLSSHLAIARKEHFALGVKLVRGAYLGSDPRHLIHDTKADTDNAYDSISASLARRTFGSVLTPAAGETVFPQVNVVLAGHNLVSVRKVQAIRTQQAANGEPQIDLIYAQLQGMADEVSCELVHAGLKGGEKVDVPKAYKYLVWGTTGECMKYLLRRAEENKDAVQRTRDGRDAMGRELIRRFKGIFGRA